MIPQVELAAFNIYIAVFQNIVWRGKLSMKESLPAHVVGIGCEQGGDAIISPDDRYNYGAVFCVNVKTRGLSNVHN